MVQAGGSQCDENLARSGLGIGDVLVPDDVGAAVFVDANCFQRQNPVMTGAELTELAADLGIDVVGAARAEPYAETEQQIVERRERGLFADMRFTMARPEVSCHPELLLEGAKTVVAAALCYVTRAPEPRPDEGRLPRYTWRDEYATLRDRLDALGRRLGGAYRVLVDDNDHVDRAAAVRSGLAFYGKNTMAITRRHGSWVVLGVLVTDVEIEPTPALELDCGECRLCIDACPTGALDDPGTLDATKCLSYWSQAPAAIPHAYRSEMGDMVYGCDICQEVCPWNRGVERRRRGARHEPDSQPAVSLIDWLERDGDELVDEFDRLYVPRNDPRWLRRNALIAAGNVGGPALRASVERHEESDDAILADAARWATARMAERGV
jgi:epoxyqueuosine reductase